MLALEFIREKYKPIQPTARLNDSQILYREIAASQNISNFEYCISRETFW